MFKESLPDPGDASDSVTGVSKAWRKSQGFPDREEGSAGWKGEGGSGERKATSSGSGSSGSESDAEFGPRRWWKLEVTSWTSFSDLLLTTGVGTRKKP